MLTEKVVVAVPVLFLSVSASLFKINAICSFRGEHFWGSFTTLIIFAPFMARLVFSGLSLAVTCFKSVKYYSTLLRRSVTWYKYEKDVAKFEVDLQSMKAVFWDFPFLQPIKFVNLKFSSILMSSCHTHLTHFGPDRVPFPLVSNNSDQ